jgi:hypothetical protein
LDYGAFNQLMELGKFDPGMYEVVRLFVALDELP